MKHAQIKRILMEKGWEEEDAEAEADSLAEAWLDAEKDYQLEEKHRANKCQHESTSLN